MPSIEDLERIAIRMVLSDAWPAFRARQADRDMVCTAIAARIVEFTKPLREAPDLETPEMQASGRRKPRKSATNDHDPKAATSSAVNIGQVDVDGAGNPENEEPEK